MVGAFSSQNLSSSVTHDRSRAILISSPTLMHSESWTTSSRYPEEPAGLLALDPQLVCYSWVTGIAEVAQVVFVRKRLVEVQYLRTTITDEQRQELALQCILLCFCFCTGDKHSLWKEVARYPLNLDSHVYDGLLVFC